MVRMRRRVSEGGVVELRGWPGLAMVTGVPIGLATGDGAGRDEASWGSGVGGLIEEGAGGALGGDSRVDSRVRDGDGDGGAAADPEVTVGSGRGGLGFFLAENEFGGFRAFFEDGGGFSESI